MDSFDDLKYDKLQEDVGKCFKMNQNDIRNVNEILELGCFTLPNNCDYNEFDNLDLELFKWKRMSQLIINLFNDYEIYKSLVVNLTALNDVCLHYLVPDTDSRPSEDDVIQALYKYVLYFLLIQRKERKMDWDKMISGISVDNLKCWMCECELELNEYECSACSEPIENTIRIKKQIQDVEMKTKLVGDYKKLQLNGGNDLMDKENDMEGVVETLLPAQLEIYSDDEWKCDKCGTLNSTNYLTCASCFVSRPKSCEVCKTVNEASKDRCIQCGHNFVDFNDKNCKICHKNEVINDGRCRKCLEIWSCIFCHFTENYRQMDFCGSCGFEKSKVKIKGELISRWKDDKLDQIWICEKCDHVVESIYSICTGCGASKYEAQYPNRDYKKMYPNIPVGKSIENRLTDGKWQCRQCYSVNLQTFLSCLSCRVPRMEIWTCIKCTTENKMSTYQCSVCSEYTKPWSCRYSFCKKENYGDSKFCKHCGLDKSFTGYEVLSTRNLYGKPDEVWICKYCSRMNEMCSYFCSGLSCKGCKPYLKMCCRCTHYSPSYMTHCRHCNYNLR